MSGIGGILKLLGDTEGPGNARPFNPAAVSFHLAAAGALLGATPPAGAVPQVRAEPSGPRFRYSWAVDHASGPPGAPLPPAPFQLALTFGPAGCKAPPMRVEIDVADPLSTPGAAGGAVREWVQLNPGRDAYVVQLGLAEDRRVLRAVVSVGAAASVFKGAEAASGGLGALLAL